MKLPDKLTQFYNRLKKIQHLRSIEGLLDWDQQVNLPENATDWRSSQCAFLAELLHAEQASDYLFDLTCDLATYRDQLTPDDSVNVTETLSRLERERKLPKRLVIEKAKLTSSTYHLWVEAKEESNYKKVSQSLEQLIKLCREEARCTRVSDNLYDSMLDIYEAGANISEIGPLLISCADAVSNVLPTIIDKMGSTPVIKGHFPIYKQKQFCTHIASLIGYEFSDGRLDTAPHPFQSTLGPNDFRITTRWDESNFLPALFGVIHEAGHALYEQGLPKKWYGTPRGSSISLGIHESQSRFWENIIGRSRSFAEVLTKPCKDFFGVDLSSNDIWKSSNQISRSLIRVEADEVSYTLHIVIRMILEEKLINGELSVKDLPEAWNTLYEKYLGIRPPSDQDGVLQDIHWYSGNIGYFPTYALGNLYAAMFYDRLRTDIPNFDLQISNGTFQDIKAWMNKNVYTHGMLYRAPQLLEKISGQKLSIDSFISYIKEKYLM